MGFGEWIRKIFRPAAASCRSEADPPEAKPPEAGPSAPLPDAREATGLEIRRERHAAADCTSVILHGVLTSDTADQLENEILNLISARQARLCIGLQDVGYISSRGWGTLISVLKTTRQLGGDIVIVGMRPHIAQLFFHAGLASIFKTYDDQAAAVEAFRAPSP